MASRRVAVISGIAALFWAATLVAAAEKAEKKEAAKPRIVVKDLKANGISEDDASVLTSQLCTEISKDKDFDVVCSTELQALLEHAAIQINLSECEADQCLKDIGKSTKADYIVFGTVGKIEKVFLLQLQLIECESGKILSNSSDKTEKGISELLDKIQSGAKRLMEGWQKKE